MVGCGAEAMSGDVSNSDKPTDDAGAASDGARAHRHRANESRAPRRDAASTAGKRDGGDEESLADGQKAEPKR
jgi:hypothetical protein